MNNATKTKLLEQETSWDDPRFQKPEHGADFHSIERGGNDWLDSRFSQPDETGSGLGSRKLKEFLAEQSAPSGRFGWKDFRGPFQYKSGYWYFDLSDGEQREVFKIEGSATEKDRVLGDATDYMANLYEEENPIHELTSAQKLEVARIAQSAGVTDDYVMRPLLYEQAITKFIAYSFGTSDDDPDYQATLETAATDYQAIADAAIYFVFVNSHVEVAPTDAFREFADEYANGRPYSLPMLEKAWEKFNSQTPSLPRRKPHGSLLPTAPQQESVTTADLNHADDKTIFDLMRNVRKARARGR